MNDEKKHTCILVITFIGLITFGILMKFVAFPYLDSIVNNRYKQAFTMDVKEYLTSDSTFLENYGTLISLESDDSVLIKNEDVVDQDEYYMDFQCVTNKGSFLIRVYECWNEHSGTYFRYAELPIQ